MTSDDRLLLRIDRIKDWLNAVGNHADAIWIEETIARIRELEAQVAKLTDLVNWFDDAWEDGHCKADWQVILKMYQAKIRAAQPDSSD